MRGDLEQSVTSALRRRADSVDVPAVPDLPEVAAPERRWAWVAVAAVAAVVAIAALVPILSRTGRDAPPAPRASQTEPQPPRTLADLPAGKAPRLAYVSGGSSVVLRDSAIELEWHVAALTRGTDDVLVYDATGRRVHRVGRDGTSVVAENATSAPVRNGFDAWIDGGDHVVRRTGPGQDQQPLPEGCCTNAEVTGVDADMTPDVYVTADEGAWLWEAYEGREGVEPQPPDSDQYLWPIGGLDGGRLVDVGVGSEVLVQHVDGTWGWGYVGGRRDPASDAPLAYVEQERTTAERVWLTVDAVVVLARPQGPLVVLGSEWQYADGVAWRALDGARKELGLPGGVRVDGVIAESRRTVLVDATDSRGERAWVRCDLRTEACEVAAELGPEDVLPE